MHSLREISLLAESRSFQNLPLEIQRRVVEIAGKPGMIHELLVRDLELNRWPVTGIIHEKNGSGTGHDVERKTEYENSGEDDDTDEIVQEIPVNTQQKISWNDISYPMRANIQCVLLHSVRSSKRQIQLAA
nr:hypothetical protein PanWU01x14_170710 [Ipomoea batatas]